MPPLSAYFLYIHGVLTKELKGQTGLVSIILLIHHQALLVTQGYWQEPNTDEPLFSEEPESIHHTHLPQTVPFSCIRICFDF